MSQRRQYTDLLWNEHVYVVERDEAALSVWDAKVVLFAVVGVDWTDDQLRSLLVVYYTGVSIGESNGRTALQFDLCRLLGAKTEGP